MARNNEPTTLNDLLNRNVLLEAPVFQRRFSWQEKQLGDFWEDFDAVRGDDEDTLFMGAIILRHEAASTSSTAERWLIIDGQQRLTALSLAIIAICLEAQASAGENSTEVEEFVKDQVQHFLLPSSSGNRKLLETKVMVTTPDLDDYRSALALLGIDEVLPFGGKVVETAKIHKALDFHRDQVRQRMPLNAELKDYKALLDELVTKVELVEIHLAERHDPNQVFNRLNTKGQDLSLGDLVRNEAFSRFSGDREAANLAFRSYWKQFEDRFQSDKSREDYYWPFTLAREPSATKGRAFALLRERWEKLGDVKGADDAAAAMRLIVEDLGQFVDQFNLLHDAQQYEGIPEPLSQAALSLHRMRLPTVTYCFLLQVLEAATSKKLNYVEAVKTLQVVESFLVRRALIGLEPTGLHSVFKRLWKETAGHPAAVRHGLVSSTMYFPGDDEVRQKLPKVNMYKRRLRNFILGEYERSIMAGDPLSEAQLTTFTVDHVAPQAFVAQWVRKYRLSRDEVDELVNSWGNLVPLSAEANSSKGASDWNQAKTLLSQETIYSTTKRLLVQYDRWGPEEVRDRTKELTEWAIARWPDSSV